MNLKSVVSFLMIFLMGALLSPKVFAAMSCHEVHQKKQISWRTETHQARPPMDGDLDLKKLKKYGFRVENNRLMDRNGKDLGELRVLDVKYLYEWAPKEYHEAWIKTGGIDDAYMKRVLEIAPQMLGRGFYVSLHPTDSAGFGSTLTVFPVTRPLVILKANDSLLKQDAVALERMGKAGVDAISEYHRSWLAIINSQHLQNPQKASQTLVPEWRAEKDLKKVVQAITSYLENSPDKTPNLLLEAFKGKITLEKSLMPERWLLNLFTSLFLRSNLMCLHTPSARKLNSQQ